MLATTRQAKRGIGGSTETLRRWLHEVDGVGKRAQLVAQDDDPHRVERLARSRLVDAPWRRWEALVLADDLDSQLRPQVGDAWRPKGTHMAVMTPGTKAQHDLAGALEVATGTLFHGCGPRQTHARCRDLLPVLEER